MKLIIDIPEEKFNNFIYGDSLDDEDYDEIVDFIAQGTCIPNNATNGDVIKTMFPNTESRLDEKTGIVLVKWADGTAKAFKADWWDAPYKGENNDQSRID